MKGLQKQMRETDEQAISRIGWLVFGDSEDPAKVEKVFGKRPSDLTGCVEHATPEEIAAVKATWDDVIAWGTRPRPIAPDTEAAQSWDRTINNMVKNG
jgi:hypothetical protein